jgi:hypothetical protein
MLPDINLRLFRFRTRKTSFRGVVQMGKTRRSKRVRRSKRGGQSTVEAFVKVVDEVTETLSEAEEDGKKKILAAFADLSPEDKDHVNKEFMPITDSLDMSKHAEMGSKLYSFQKMH